MRKSKICRNTLETRIEVDLAIDGSGDIAINSGIGFFDHMLKAMAFYAGFDLHINCQGDLHIDSHHTLEDIGLTLGAAFKEALGDKKGIQRFASPITPMDESLVLVAIDISNRPYLVENLKFNAQRMGDLETENFKEFFQAFTVSAAISLHIDVIRGENDHHKIEAVFKGLGRAIKEAAHLVGSDVVSTKGVL
ncbi:MAG TPA: imidazoleglycerol-phosphate dehydratase HisB [Clostridia bacterium]|nr:imidazoleglycerol-phosphate dehydratase HisB [Clostridia bacterium]